MCFAGFDLGERRTLELVEFVEPRSSVRASGPSPYAGHLALRVADLAALVARLTLAGTPLVGELATIDELGFWHGARACYVVDPDGVTVALMEWPAEATGRPPLTDSVANV